jgi:hypothetical protein
MLRHNIEQQARDDRLLRDTFNASRLHKAGKQTRLSNYFMYNETMPYSLPTTAGCNANKCSMHIDYRK